MDETGYVLALWLERSSWDRRERRDIDNEPEALQLSFADAVTVTSHLLDGETQADEAPRLVASGAPLDLAVSDAVTLLILNLE